MKSSGKDKVVFTITTTKTKNSTTNQRTNLIWWPRQTIICPRHSIFPPRPRCTSSPWTRPGTPMTIFNSTIRILTIPKIPKIFSNPSIADYNSQKTPTSSMKNKNSKTITPHSSKKNNGTSLPPRPHSKTKESENAKIPKASKTSPSASTISSPKNRKPLTRKSPTAWLKRSVAKTWTNKTKIQDFKICASYKKTNTTLNAESTMP